MLPTGTGHVKHSSELRPSQGCSCECSRAPTDHHLVWVLPPALEHQPCSVAVLRETWSAQTIVLEALEDHGLHVSNCKTLQCKLKKEGLQLPQESLGLLHYRAGLALRQPRSSHNSLTEGEFCHTTLKIFQTLSWWSLVPERNFPVQDM